MFPKRTIRRRPKRPATRRRPLSRAVAVGAAMDYRGSLSIPYNRSQNLILRYRRRSAAIGVAQRNRVAMLGAYRCDYSVALQNKRFIRRR